MSGVQLVVLSLFTLTAITFHTGSCEVDGSKVKSSFSPFNLLLNEVSNLVVKKQFIELTIGGPFETSPKRTDWILGKWALLVVDPSGDHILTFVNLEGGVLENNPKGSNHWFFVVGDMGLDNSEEDVSMDSRKAQKTITHHPNGYIRSGMMLPAGKASFGIILLEGDDLKELELDLGGEFGDQYFPKKIDKRLRGIITKSMKDIFIHGKTQLKEKFLDHVEKLQKHEL